MEVIDNNGHDFTQTQEQSDRVNVPIKKSYSKNYIQITSLRYTGFRKHTLGWTKQFLMESKLEAKTPLVKTSTNERDQNIASLTEIKSGTK